MKRYSFKLNAGETSVYGIVGDFVHIFSALGDLTIKTDTGDIIILPQQMGWHTADIFKSISFLSDIDQTITFYCGFGRLDDNRTIIVGEVDNSSGGTLVVHSYYIAAYASQLIAAKDMSRTGLTVQNIFADLCILGDGSGDGINLQGGDLFSITQGCKAEWHVNNTSPNGVKIKVIEVLP